MKKSYRIICNNFIGLCLLAVANAGFAKGTDDNPTIVTGEVDAYVTNTVDVSVTNDETNPVPVEVINDSLSVNVSSESHFVGFSTARTSGRAGGYTGMSEICDVEFANARICTTKEWFNTHGRQKPRRGESAWVQPTLSAATYLGDTADSVSYTDWTGHTIQLPTSSRYDWQATCDSWSSPRTARTGYVVQTLENIRSDDGLQITTCNNVHRVTCCTLPH